MLQCPTACQTSTSQIIYQVDAAVPNVATLADQWYTFTKLQYKQDSIFETKTILLRADSCLSKSTLQQKFSLVT